MLRRLSGRRVGSPVEGGDSNDVGDNPHDDPSTGRDVERITTERVSGVEGNAVGLTVERK